MFNVAGHDTLLPQFRLSANEAALLAQARELDAEGKRSRERREKEDIEIIARRLDRDGEFDASSISDAQDRVLRYIARRRGQPGFRRRLLQAYGGRCTVSGCAVEAVLEAAHIVPHRGPKTNHVANGLLLRADLHTLFDLKLIAIDKDMRLLVSPSLAGTFYEEYRGRPITVPGNPHSRPSHKATEEHRRGSGL